MNEESRPKGAAPDDALATHLSIAHTAEIEPRAGQLVRVTFERCASGECLVCGATFTATGPAASHARSARHTVQCSYSTRFAFIAVESLDGGAR